LGTLGKDNQRTYALVAQLLQFQDASIRGAAEEALCMMARFIRSYHPSEDSKEETALQNLRGLAVLTTKQCYLIVKMVESGEALNHKDWFEKTSDLQSNSMFESPDEMNANLQMLLQTGFVIPLNTNGTTLYKTTSNAALVVKHAADRTF
jgi:hypothetical protein